MALAKAAYNGLINLRALVNVERKFKLGVVNNEVMTTTGTFYLLSGIAQGDGETQRNGDKVKLSSISIKGLLQLDIASDPLSRAMVRIILINDKVSNGIAPTAAQLLLTNTIYGHYNPDNCPSRFKILSDKVYNMNLDKTNQIYWRLYENLSHHLTFTGITENQADANTGHIYLYVITDLQVNTTLDFNSKLTFVDN